MWTVPLDRNTDITNALDHAQQSRERESERKKERKRKRKKEREREGEREKEEKIEKRERVCEKRDWPYLPFAALATP